MTLKVEQIEELYNQIRFITSRSFQVFLSVLSLSLCVQIETTQVSNEIRKSHREYYGKMFE